MKSVLQKKIDRCYFCGRPAVHKHHVFNGANRKNSEEWGMTVHLCATCHEVVHTDQSLDELLKRKAQHVFEELHSREKFMQVFKKNYCWEEDLLREKSSDNWKE